MITTADPIRYTGRSYDPATGTIELGPGHDTAAPAAWQLYAKGAMLSGFISHGSGMGASCLLDLLGHSALASGCTVVWQADPQGGVASPALVDAVDAAARSMSETRALIEEACGLFEKRAAAQRRRGVRGFTPSPTEPGLLILMEEFEHLAADRQIRSSLEKIATNGMHRSEHVGIAFAAVVGPVRHATFGGSPHLRAMIGHNQVYLHQTGRAPLGLPDLLDRIPQVPGLGFHKVAHQAVNRSGGVDFFRARYLGDAADTRRWFAQLPAHRPVLPGV